MHTKWAILCQVIHSVCGLSITFYKRFSANLEESFKIKLAGPLFYLLLYCRYPVKHSLYISDHHYCTESCVSRLSVCFCVCVLEEMFLVWSIL
nr:hypothetical protein CFP56_22979 [Quercus suber]